MLSPPTMRGALFYIEDDVGNQIGTASGYLAAFISESYTDEDGRLCVDFELSGTPAPWLMGSRLWIPQRHP